MYLQTCDISIFSLFRLDKAQVIKYPNLNWYKCHNICINSINIMQFSHFFWTFLLCLCKNQTNKWKEYQPSSTRGTRSTPAMLQRLLNPKRPYHIICGNNNIYDFFLPILVCCTAPPHSPNTELILLSNWWNRWHCVIKDSGTGSSPIFVPGISKNFFSALTDLLLLSALLLSQTDLSLLQTDQSWMRSSLVSCVHKQGNSQ